MYTWKVFQLMANYIQAYKNGIDTARDYATLDVLKYESRGTYTIIEKLVNNYLPHGSGINYDYDIDAIIINSNQNKLTFFNRYDTMLENGMYDRIIDFKVIVIPSLIHTLDINIIGNFGKDQHIKDYLIGCYYTALTQEVTQQERIALNG